MSVLVKGMEMPTSCPCSLLGIGYDTYCFAVYGIPKRCLEYELCCKNETRPDWCPLAEVPTPHGRLIDGDVLEEKAIEKSEKHGEMANVLDNVITAYDISIAPTIIQAEEGE